MNGEKSIKMENACSTILCELKDIGLWVEIILSSIFIPVSIFLGKWIYKIYSKTRPENIFLKEYLGPKLIRIYITQLQSQNNGHFDLNYLTSELRNKSNLHTIERFNINCVYPEAEVEILNELYSIFGLKKKNLENIKISDLTKEHLNIDDPIITLGFNPRTLQLLEFIGNDSYFQLKNNMIIFNNNSYDSLLPYDHGVIQKVYLDNTPIIIIAGLGTYGTRAAGYILKKYFTEISKSFRDNEFCILVRVNVTTGYRSAEIIDYIVKKKNKKTNKLMFSIMKKES